MELQTIRPLQSQLDTEFCILVVGIDTLIQHLAIYSGHLVCVF